MFDLLAGTLERPLRERAPLSKVVAALIHGVVLTLLVGIPLLRVTNVLPEVPAIMAFVAAPAAPPPPPPPPPARAVTARPVVRPTPKLTGAFAAPIEAPDQVGPEAAAVAADEKGVEGGVEGGIPGGILGGIVGGLVSPAPPPPPPPPPSREPVRIGGQLTAPALVHRVEPTYPELAAAAQVGGIVILEAIVASDGCVESVKMLRSTHRLLDRAAVDALKQWKYSPLVLDGVPTRFVLTVTFNFSVKR